MGKPQVDWHGSFAVIVTPFDVDGAVDEGACRAVVDLVIAAGCHGVIAAGSTGEFFLMTGEERRRVFRIAVEQAGGRVPVLGCPMALGETDILRLSEDAAAAGCAGLMVLPTLYVPLTEAQIKGFYQRVSAAAGLPIMLYNSPRYVNASLSADFVAELTEIEQVVAIKDTTFDLYTTSRLIRRCGPDLKVFIGLEDLLVPALAIGAVGAVAMLPQVVGPMAVELYDAAVAGDRDRARVLHHKMSRAYDLFGLGGGYMAIKAAMNLLGKPGGHSRLPLTPLDEDEIDSLRAILVDLELL